MKAKFFFVTAFFTATAVFGAEITLSAGAGGILGGSFTRYTLAANGSAVSVSAGQNVDQIDYGFLGFFDATYGTFTAYLQAGANRFDEPVNPAIMSRSGQGWETVIGFSLLGKYPFSLNDRLTVFPLLGMDYQMSLLQRRTDAYGKVYDRAGRPENGINFDLMDFNSFHVRLGGGAEYRLMKGIFIRGDLLYGIRLMTGYESRNLDYMREMTGDSNPKLGGLSSGPSVRLAAGYRFHSF